ncbi:hypothetical protein A0H81_02090 [Grifola frondosa]|uniref:Uncharacterized protein n=1 Tax=Grifola frondosa TaxID=5627 RepID=A0A1C7MNN6_GRIFR|nr:hypothetical protein A0H81_02090 [Grifola frondosa]
MDAETVRKRARPEILHATRPFPPKPCSPHDEADFIRSWCDAFAHDAVWDGLTRLERSSADETIREIRGPVLYHPAVHVVDGEDVIDICTTCYNVVKRGNIPAQSLANGLWIGDVPLQLQKLTFLECMLVARVRHNYFVAKVDKGQRKLCANAIMFAQPVGKLYSVLPPPRAELDQCLALLFVRSTKPTPADWKRTPFLVRHLEVMDALRWLKLNHSEYGNVDLSDTNMRQYCQDEPPVCVVYRPGDGKAPAESLSVNDLEDEKGTDYGACSFAVHGLTGSQFASMSHQQKIATALRWFRTGGKALAYGHDNSPESIFHNPPCARFFNFMVETFISRILRPSSTEDGLFGPTEAYYGTVESQGRLTLHLHLLL